MSRRSWVTVDRRSLAIIGVLVLAFLIPVAVWQFQGAGMRSDFVQALRTGDVGGLPVDLQGKRWSEQELAQVEVLAVPDSAGTQRAISREIYERGRVLVSSHQYAYQGTIVDASTGILHVFGFQRRQPRVWRWVTIHPSSFKLHIERRQEQLDEMYMYARPSRPEWQLPE